MNDKKYNTYVVVGLQWGDEGKGKIIDLIASSSDYVVRFQGGNNAGHTVMVGDEKTTLDMLPSGIISTKGKCILAAGTVIDVDTFLDEVYNIEKNGKILDNLYIDGRANVIMPYHTMIDVAKQNVMGKNVIKTSKNGITPCYCDKISKKGIRIADLLDLDTLADKLLLNLKEKNNILEKYDEIAIDFDYIFEKYKDFATKLRYRIIDDMYEINKAVDSGKKVLFEGTQALMLDTTFGTYPNVSSAVSMSGGVCTGVGIAPQKLTNIIGVFKSYTTRVMDGLFPTEMDAESTKLIRKNGNEFVESTGYARRCGWLDLVTLKYAVMINGITQLHMTKLDILSGFETIKLAVAYEIDKKVYDSYPVLMNDNTEYTVLYKEFDGFNEDISNITEYELLPENCKKYIEYIEGYLEVKITLISVGPKKEQIILR